MPWDVLLHPAFRAEFNDLSEEVQDAIAAQVRVLGQFGPTLGRPRVDALNGSRFPNMKELRFNADNGVWRVAFAFDPNRQAFLLVAGDKSGVSERRFYREFISRADDRYTQHLTELEHN